MRAIARAVARSGRSLVIVAGLVLMVPAVAAANDTTGTVSGLPIPRFVSLKPSDTPMREGPSKDHRIRWVFKKEGVPVEILAEFETWRRVRDAEGADGWVYHSRLSGRRTAQVAPWLKTGLVSLHERDTETATVVARLEPGVIAALEQCSGTWCRVRGEGFEGWIQQGRIWGAYPGERVK